MQQVSEMTVMAAEGALAMAMLSSDVNELDKLLAEDLLFTNHRGQILGKSDDLAMHKSGSLKIEKIEPLETTVQIIRGIGVVNARVRIVGSYLGHRSDAEFRFTRLWVSGNADNLQVRLAHSSIVAG